MKRTPINIDLSDFPEEFRSYMSGADIYDSSCSEAARVYFIDKDSGYYLKSSTASLKREAEMTAYLYSKKMASKVVEYVTGARDWLLCRRVPGEDGTFRAYLDEPERLCELFADTLRALHDMDGSDCPVKDRRAEYLASAERGYREGRFDISIFPESTVFSSADDAWKYLSENARCLKNDTLIHGDYCLPNVMFENWRFSGFIDVGNGGMGDRHIDLFWGAWTLWFNLKTEKYTDRFFDAYGRDRVDKDMLKLVSAAEVFG